MSRGISESQRWMLELMLQHDQGQRVPVHKLNQAYWSDESEEKSYKVRSMANRNANRALRSLEKRGLVTCDGIHLVELSERGVYSGYANQYCWSLTEAGKRLLAEEVIDRQAT